jgi:hypothetical protein
MVIAQEQPRNIISQVELRQEIESVWIDALADVGKAIRLHSKLSTGFLDIGDDVAVEHPGGVLQISTTIAGELIEMGIPPGMWRYPLKGNSVDTNSN